MTSVHHRLRLAVGALTVAVNPDAAAPDGLPLHGRSASRYDVHVRAAAEHVLPLLLPT